MKAFVHEGSKGLTGTSYRDMNEESPGRKEVKVRMKIAGLNHRDLSILEKREETDPPLIIGSDGAGIIDEVGDDVTSVSVGDEVIINPSLGWLDKSEAPPEGFQIIGLPGHGTFSESIVISENNIEPKPPHLSWEEAGVLSLGALTAYRALFTRANIDTGDTVLLPGIGGGVATLLLLFAKAAGARVIVTSRSNEKLEKALELGADVAIDSEGDWDESLHGEKADIVIETVGAATFNKSLNQLRRGGTIVTFGSSTGDDVSFNLRDFFYGQKNLLGSTMGSRAEFREMLHFIGKHDVKPVMDKTFPLADTKAAMERLKEAKQLGKIAIKIDN
ncbi:zinc-binding dehydrogenase [Salipaludibacillus sp. CF4.18]|uniref:zinc-binding dehydrogenase n=1 Tax=Salipaludibacillus sp. CF4.18 TaxID=3373081 RepID=UPI003EE44D2E